MKAEFDIIKDALDKFDGARETIIKESRGILKNAKQAIYALHRDDLVEAKKLLEEAKKIKKALEEKIVDNSKLQTGAFANSCEEYAEAFAFLVFIEESRLATRDEMQVTIDEYLGGLADLTGELGRLAVIKATERDVATVKKIKDFTEELYGQFVRLDFRNGELRRKYDAMKYNLQKMERVLYELTLAK